MRKIFIDCGCNQGQSIKLFRRSRLYSPEFIIYGFEANPACFRYLEKFKGDFVQLANQAVWIKDETRDFYLSSFINAVGSSLKTEKKSGRMNKAHPITVQCFDFSKWILNNFTGNDYIILKMDIEGAEYDVLNKMINDRSINLIKKAFVEFHVDKMNIDIKIHEDLIQTLRCINGFELLPEMYKYLLEK